MTFWGQQHGIQSVNSQLPFLKHLKIWHIRSLADIDSQIPENERRFTTLTPLTKLISAIPSTLYSMRKILWIDRFDFTPSTTKKSVFVRWPDHPQRSKRKPCHTQLCIGRTKNPRQVFCMHSFTFYLWDLAKQNYFIKRCIDWRQWAIRGGYLGSCGVKSCQGIWLLNATSMGW